MKLKFLEISPLLFLRSFFWEGNKNQENGIEYHGNAMLNASSRETTYIYTRTKGTINQDACYQKPPSRFRWNRREPCASAAFGVRLIKFTDSEEWRATRRCILRIVCETAMVLPRKISRLLRVNCVYSDKQRMPGWPRL